jgi:hypothetical protein
MRTCADCGKEIKTGDEWHVIGVGLRRRIVCSRCR